MKAAAALLLVVAGAARAEPGHWDFQALLDGSPIGTHSFTLSGPPERREMAGRADFAVKVLGITAYTYHHVASEQWQGDCLESLAASTDDDGTKTVVRLHRAGDGMALTGPQGPQTLGRCVMTFAYWNPKILQASKLLDPQSGKYQPVTVTDLGPGTIDVRGRQVAARHWRIDGPGRPIELWYAADGDWLGLDSMVGKRRLSYRLQ